MSMSRPRKTGRTAFGEMLRYLRRHPEVRILLVEKTDRLYRNLKDWATVDELGVEVHFVKEIRSYCRIAALPRNSCTVSRC